MKNKKFGPLMMCLSSVGFSLGGLCIKNIPWSPISINFFRCLVAFIMLSAYLLITKKKLKFNKWVLLGAVAMFITNNLFVVATKMTTAANAIVLQFTAPIFTMLLSLIFMKKKPKKLDIIVCAFVFAGIICFFVEKLSTGGMIGNILALTTGVTYAMMFMMNDFPEGDSVSSTFFGLLMSVIFGVPFFAGETDFGTSALLYAVILGVFQMGISYILFSEGLKLTEPVTASLVSGLEPVLNPLLVALFAGETMSLLALIGEVIVLGSIITYNVIKAKQTA